MEREISHASMRDYDELLDFLGLIFGKSYGTFDFEKTFPTVFRRDSPLLNSNLIYRESGRIRGNIGVFPFDLIMGSHHLKAYHIACVSTHPSVRGRGIMSRLMHEALKIADADADFACLGGFRQRYATFGFEKAGTCLRIQISKDNIRRAYNKVPALRFEQVTPDACDIIQWMHDLYYSQSVRIDRDRHYGFYNTLIAYNQMPYIVYSEDNKKIGYLISQKNSVSLFEQLADSPQHLCDMVCAWLNQSAADSISVTLQPWETDASRALTALSESSDLAGSYSFRIINWISVMRAAIELKSNTSLLPDGSFIIDIEGYGKIVFAIRENKVRCNFTDQKPDLQLSPLMATRFFFGPLPPWLIMSVPRHVERIVNALFPLPWSIAKQDRI